ncbi:hypothetical protein Ciccas_010316 [Cichlidogyrus casuarinus]|uniref:CARD domain-containing protein n=1 Tax=Cichlidogyrus casuarinus TaxID=1844966 RepID=A0ABD2PW28_9PLAT
MSFTSSQLSNEFLSRSLSSSNQGHSVNISESLSSNPDGLRASRLAYTQRSNREANTLIKWTLLKATKALLLAHLRYQICNQDESTKVMHEHDTFRRAKMLLNYAFKHKQDSKTQEEVFYEMDSKDFRVGSDCIADKVVSFLSRPDLHKVLRRLYVRGYLSEKLWSLIYPKHRERVNIFNWPIELLSLVAKADLLHREKQHRTTLRRQRASATAQLDALQKMQTIRTELEDIQAIESRFLRNVNGSELLLQFYTECLGRFNRCLEAMSTACPLSINFVEWAGKMLETIDWSTKTAASVIDTMETTSVCENWEYEWDKWHQFELAENERIQKEQIKRATVSSDLTLLGERMPELDDLVVKSTGQNNSQKRRQNYNQMESSMNMEEKKVVDVYRSRLCEEVRADGILDYLIVHRVLSLEDSAEIFSSLETRGQMRRLIEILTTK